MRAAEQTRFAAPFLQLGLSRTYR